MHLYDPDQLIRSPIAIRLGIANRSDALTRLQNILTKAIEGIKPKPGTPSQSRSWRIYDLLNFCYLQQLNQDAASNQIGISSRHLRRERQAALEALAYFLIEKYPDDFKNVIEGEPKNGSSAEEDPIPTVAEELAWINDSAPKDPVNVEHVVKEVFELIRPLVDQYRGTLVLQDLSFLSGMSLHQVALKEILIDLISLLIRWVPGGKVTITSNGSPIGPFIQAVGEICGSELQKSNSDSHKDLLAQIVSLGASKVDYSINSERVVVEVYFQIKEQYPILVIDDNADVLQLFSRYTENTSYRLVGAKDLAEALLIINEIQPKLILLDVMMPHMDGWNVLGTLRNHPMSNHIPVVICSVLAQEELARSLGASGYIRKPVTRPDFLAGLDHHFEQMKKESRKDS
jgi:CheY-like chemotaxis protein